MPERSNGADSKSVGRLSWPGGSNPSFSASQKKYHLKGVLFQWNNQILFSLFMKNKNNKTKRFVDLTISLLVDHKIDPLPPQKGCKW